MPSTRTRDLPEEFLAATRKSQEAMIRAIKTWVETVRTVTPNLPSVYAPLADRLPKLPSVTVPFADKLPKPEDVVASGYDFAEHLLAIQRKFAEDLLAATEPLIPANGKRAWQDATRKDAAAAAEKTVTAAKTAVTETAQATQQAVAQAAPKPAEPKPAEPKPAEPKPAARKTPAPKSATPKPAAAKSAPKPATTRRAPKATGTS
jgi:cell division protein FtsN